jgi:predicted DNA-binding protein YlxM (UPF0122 family)
MNEEAIRDEIKRRKEIFRREQSALSFREKVRIAFEMSNRRNIFKQAKLIQQKDIPASLPEVNERR